MGEVVFGNEDVVGIWQEKLVLWFDETTFKEEKKKGENCKSVILW